MRKRSLCLDQVNLEGFGGHAQGERRGSGRPGTISVGRDLVVALD